MAPGWRQPGDFTPGEIMAIIGPNGAGKTTMLNIINGFYKPDEGRVIFEGEERPKKNETEPYSGSGNRQDISESGPLQRDVSPWKHHGGSDYVDAFQHLFPGALLEIQPEKRRSNTGRP